MSTLTHRSSPWPRAIVSVFILLALANALILYLALNSRTMPIVDSPYENGLEYEKIIEAKNAASLDQVIPSIAFTENGIKLNVSGLEDANKWQIQIKLLRADARYEDLIVRTEGVGSEFIFDNLDIKPGLWLIQLTINNKETNYYFDLKQVKNP